MKVTLFAYDLSTNSLSRTYLIAELLTPRYDVEIVGPMTTSEVWEPLAGEYDYRGVETSTQLREYLTAQKELVELIDGDVVVARKPRAVSYGTALWHKLRSKTPVVIDIEDWESGFQLSDASSLRRRISETYINPTNVDSYPYTRLSEALVRFADGVIVANEFLQDRFGGTIIPHARNPEKFDPGKYDKTAVREEFGLPRDGTLVVFAGTPHQYKGVSDFLAAAERIEDDDFYAVIVGADESEYSQQLRERASDHVIVRGRQPFDQMPKWNLAGDILVIPQRRNRSTIGQLPAKLIEGMALQRPIISTAVGDIPEVLGDGGLVVEPGSVSELESALQTLIDDPRMREKLAKQGRKRFLDRYTHSSYEQIAQDVVESALD